MKILIIRNFPNYMDVRNATYNIQELGLALALSRRNHRVGLVLWTDGEEESFLYKSGCAEVMIYYRKAIVFLKNGFYKDINSIIDQYDIIQMAEYNQFQVWQYAKKYSSKLVIYHGQYYGKINRKYNMMCRVFDLFGLHRYRKNNTLFITKSQLSKQYLVDRKIMEDNVVAVGVGLNPGAFCCDTENPLTDFCNQFRNQEINILYVGNFAVRRHLEFIGDVVKKLNEEGHKANFVIVGGKNTPYGEQCWKYFQEQGIMPYVYYAEKAEQKHMGMVYQSSDFLLFPAEYEIFGMVLLEAMYFGTIVISATNGGSCTLIQDGENGFIKDNLDIEEWCQLILEVNGNRNTKVSIKQKAHETICHRFTWDALAEKFEKVYLRRLS